MRAAQIPSEWQVNSSLPTPLGKQLAMNVRWSICTGRMRAGETLPPIRDLARHLNLSVNTVREAYRILEEQRLVVARPRRGTEVVADSTAGMVLVPPADNDVEDALLRAVLRAVTSGYTVERLRECLDRMIDRIGSLNSDARIAFVECTSYDAEKLAAQVSSDLGIPVEPVVLDRLDEWLRSEADSFRPVGAVVTTFFHYSSVMQSAHRHNLPVFGVVVENDPETLEQVASMPPGAKIGVICRRQDSTQYFFNRVRSLVKNNLEIRSAYLDDVRQLDQLLRWGDSFFVTQPCKPVIERMAPHAKVFLFYDRINEQSLAMLRQHLRGMSLQSTASS